MLARLLALVQKELIQIRRDRRTLFIVLAMPAVQILLFGYAINTTVEHQALAVLDQADDRLSRDFVRAMTGSNVFDLVASTADLEELRQTIDRGQARVGLVIPPGFGDDLTAGRTPAVQVLVDGSDSTIAQSALLSAVAIGQAFSSEQLTARLNRLGQGGKLPVVEVRPLVLYNEGMDTITFTVPGLIGMVLNTYTILLTAYSVARERERGTLEQLIVTPIRPWELMVGKMLPYIGIAYLDVLVVLAIGTLWFKVEIAGSLPLLLALSGLFLTSSLGLGLLISTVSTTQGQASQLAMFTLLPSVILSGFVFPRETMPPPLHDLGYLLPLTYFIRILRGIMTRGVGLEVLWVEALPMAALGLLLLGLASLRFRKQLG